LPTSGTIFFVSLPPTAKQNDITVLLVLVARGLWALLLLLLAPYAVVLTFTETVSYSNRSHCQHVG